MEQTVLVEAVIDSIIPAFTHVLGKPKFLYNAFRRPPLFQYKEVMGKSVYFTLGKMKLHSNSIFPIDYI
jgi:hypothetical protein